MLRTDSAAKNLRCALIIVLALIFALSACACGAASDEVRIEIEESYGLPYKLTKSRIGTSTGSAGEELMDSLFQGVEYQSFNDSLNMMIALADGKLDLAVTSRTEVNTFNRVNSIYAYSGALSPLDYHFAYKKGDSAVMENVLSVLERYRSDGTLAEIVSHWQRPEGADYIYTDIPEPASDAPELKIAVSGMLEPMYFTDGGLEKGLNVELGKRIANELNMRAVFEEVPVSTLIASIEADKCDFAMTDMLYNPERANVVELSSAYYSDEVVFAWVTANLKDVALPEFTGLAQLEGRNIAVLTGADTDSIVENAIDYAELFYCSDLATQLQMLKSGRVDAIATETPIANRISAQMGDVCAMPNKLTEHDYAYMLRHRSPLTKKINSALDELWADGTVMALQKKWLEGDANRASVEDIALTGENGTIRFAFESALSPMCFMREKTYQGYEVELIMRVAQKLGMDVKFTATSFNLLMPLLTANKADVIAGCFAIDESRKQTYDMTSYTCRGGIELIVNNYVHVETPTFFEAIATSFTNTFISESRWKLVLKGLFMTVLLSLASTFFGTALGFLICFMLKSEKKAARRFASGYVQALESMPLLVLLMILYYIVFKNADIAASVVAILAFSLNFSAYVAEFMLDGIASVSSGQLDAAKSLGLTSQQTFIKVVFPQAVRHSLGDYKRQFISLVEMTSIVGYIAIHDLTKVSDMIRSRTFEAFLPLISTAVIYFVIARMLTKLLRFVEIRIDPEHRPRTKGLKGIKLEGES